MRVNPAVVGGNFAEAQSSYNQLDIWPFFTSVTRSNGERLKRRSVQQLSNARNHDANLAEAAHSINSLRRKGFPQAAHCCSFRELPNARWQLVVALPE